LAEVTKKMSGFHAMGIASSSLLCFKRSCPRSARRGSREIGRRKRKRERERERDVGERVEGGEEGEKKREREREREERKRGENGMEGEQGKRRGGEKERGKGRNGGKADEGVRKNIVLKGWRA